MMQSLCRQFLLTGMLTASVLGDDGALRTLQSVSPTGGSAEARAAAKTLVAGGTDNLIPLLESFRGATPLGANWLRSAFDTLAAGEVSADRALPAEDFTAFILDVGQSPAARRLAYDWLLKQDATVERELIPGLLEDPQPDFRRDAVALLIEQAQAADDADAPQLYRRALAGAVHDDQVKTIAAALDAAGDPVDLQRHFGFLADWQVIGPFDNREMKGYAVAYPPESEWDPQATYDGQLDKVRWQQISTEDNYGIVDIGKQIQNFKGSLMYAVTTFRSATQRDVDFRLGTPNAWKLWVNGELVFEREEYHRSTRMDQYVVPVTVSAGNNSVMLKVCQNEQEEDWAQDYQFQLRVADSSGAAILSAGDQDE